MVGQRLFGRAFHWLTVTPLADDRTDPDYLLPQFLRVTLWRIWPSILALQWILVIPLSYATGTLFKLGDFQASTRTVPFTQDFYFCAWNLLPFALAAGIWYADRAVSKAMSEGIPDCDRPKARALATGTITLWNRRSVKTSVMVLAFAVAAIGVYQQFAKTSRWQVTHECVYWWQRQFSPLVFYIRLVTLFVNLCLLICALFAVFTLLVVFIRIARSELWRIRVLHPDGCAGLAAYGRAALAFAFMPFTASVVALLGYLDHSEAGLLQIIGDGVLMCLASGIALLTFYIPLRKIHRRMAEAQRDACRRIDDSLAQLGTLLPACGSEGFGREEIEQLRKRKEDYDILVSLYRMYDSASTWPFDLATWGRMVSMVGGPLAVFAIDLIRQYGI